MIDSEDRQVLMQVALIWFIRVSAVLIALLAGSVTFGLAWRLFDAVKG